MNKFFATALVISLFAASVRPASAVWPPVADSSAFPAFRTFNEDERVITLKGVLDSYNSPLTGEADNFVSYADNYQLDWKLVAAIAGVESAFGKRIPTGSYNAWGWAVYTQKQSGAVFKNWETGIAAVSEGLRKNYLDRGAVTPEQIGRTYAASRAWSNSVRFFLTKISEYTPASSRSLPVDL